MTGIFGIACNMTHDLAQRIGGGGRRQLCPLSRYCHGIKPPTTGPRGGDRKTNEHCGLRDA
jgi:hypothetical protein